MSYSEQLHPWCIVRSLANQEYTIVARFRRRDDAVAYLQVLRRSSTDMTLAIIFQQSNVKNSVTTLTTS